MPGTFALHTWTLDTTPLATALDAARRAGYDAVELRRIDFKRCYEQGLSNDDVLDIVSRAEVEVCTLGCEYGWLFATGAESERIFDVFVETCRTAVALGCPQVMSAPGPFTGSIRDAISNLRCAADIAAESGLTLAIEFNSQHEVLNNLDVLRELIVGADCDNCGMLLDAYHLHRSGRGGRGFEDVTKDELFAFQFSDCSPIPVIGVKRPTDRLMPGDGVILWDEVFGLLADIGFDGPLSYEAPNPDLWALSPYQNCRETLTRSRSLLAAANSRRQRTKEK
jgi:sugar phosphate isomerase/epimerase